MELSIPVLCEAISVVVRRDSIDKYFQGGWNKFVRKISDPTMCTDGELVRVGFMVSNHVQEFIDFPLWVIHSLDKQAKRLGVPRQSVVKVWIAERLEELRH